jgi:hypothetical protein
LHLEQDVLQTGVISTGVPVVLKLIDEINEPFEALLIERGVVLPEIPFQSL